MSDWQERYRTRLITPAEAAAKVKSGDLLILPVGTTEPVSICTALGQRRNELRDVRILHVLPMRPFEWYNEGADESFQVTLGFIGPASRPAMDRRQIDFLPADPLALPRWSEHELRTPFTESDVFMVQISPPDERGFCSFGEMVWFSPDYVRGAKLVIGEVNPRLIATGGDNWVQVSEIDFLVEHESPAVSLARAVPEESVEAAQIIGAYVSSLVNDGDTIQIGFGLTSGATTAYLDSKNDLGVHSEIIPAGLVPLIKNGNITGKYKTLHPGKVVASALFIQPDDFAWANNHPQIELYQATYTNDPKVISQNDNQVAINNGISIDLTGQLCVESMGPVMYSGTGGQLDFCLGALMARGGRSVTVLPSTANQGAASRIVAQHPAGAIISIPRNLVDFVVTEWGIVNLQGKSVRQRAEALIEIAHPDHREELQAQARALFW